MQFISCFCQLKLNILKKWYHFHNTLKAILEKWVPYSEWYLFNAIPDTNHNANPTNPNRYSNGNHNIEPY